MQFGTLTLAAFTFLLALAIPASAGPPESSSAAEDDSLVILLTQTDPMGAGHALHIGTVMRGEGRQATIILVGDAARLGVKDAITKISSVSGNTLQEELAAFIAVGGKVLMTPYSLEALQVSPEMLLHGVLLPNNPRGLHDHLFEPHTRLISW